ncbi:MAG: 16S rRNA (cytosine(1402)-N(4))-methyltransferase RsmH [Clostridia bacterium]|nr:16S rRNA (cytosine(1402)-N(4))-methyltransferase RsmH [Clostridia bacterium]
MEFKHIPIMFDDCINMLNIQQDGIYVDGTLGGGGHSYGICSRLGDKGRLIGIDRDSEAISAAKKRLEKFEGKVTFVNDNYANIKNVLSKEGPVLINGALLDLGVSSYQLDNPERGFSYMHNAPLDMRMNAQDGFSAYELVNTYSEKDLFRVIKDYGEEKWASRIAKFIVEARKKEDIKTTFQLNDIIKSAIPAGARKDGGHPSKRTFQAIRIEVNGEIEKLKNALSDFFDVLAPGGVLAVITFHSLEDRIVKQLFTELSTGCTCPPSFPICVCGKKPRGKIINKKPMVASGEEIENNSRSKSAKLRGITKL